MLTLAPLTVPPVVGANVTVKVADWLALSTVPLEIPLALKPAPLAVTPEIATLEFPLFVMVVVCELVVPSITFPKAMLAGLAPTEYVAVCPVPDKLITRGDGVAFVVSLIEPLTAPADEGSNVALNVALPPGPIDVDVLSPVSPNPAPETLT